MVLDIRDFLVFEDHFDGWLDIARFFAGIRLIRTIVFIDSFGSTRPGRRTSSALTLPVWAAPASRTRIAAIGASGHDSL
jgi:hypothetical protein